eukprot:CAMPEP_0195517860 /NCGR_PEP_ID=MMETSP0794_2-20130614/11791_1 /TAXON_ID=515487 /ORGANISM="Stephanopyxis turris, Strain CCMP 815" /LENGTH=130 /DNA_ID=CAMNT_0040646735 /DNA_START=34 /DNA_END=423 /DNA_ORIENTATION=+
MKSSANQPLVAGQPANAQPTAVTYGSNQGTIAQGAAVPTAEATAIPQAQYAAAPTRTVVQQRVLVAGGGAPVVNPAAYVFIGNTRMFRGPVPEFSSDKSVTVQCPACMNTAGTLTMYRWGTFAFIWYIWW